MISLLLIQLHASHGSFFSIYFSLWVTLYFCNLNIAETAWLEVYANTWWRKKTIFKSNKCLNADLDSSRNKCGLFMDRSIVFNA